MTRSPLVAGPDTDWWKREPMGRVVPAPNGGISTSSGTLQSAPERESCFRSVGNVIGLCLLHGIRFPLFMCRHVYKVLLGRKVNYADYAYFDPDNHATLLQVLLLATIKCTARVPLSCHTSLLEVQLR